MNNILCKLISTNWKPVVRNPIVKQISTQAFPLQFQATPSLWAEPLKKKKKVDPGILKARLERKKKKILKEIRKLERKGRQLKPVEDIELPSCIKEEYDKRKRIVAVSPEVVEERIIMMKEWSREKIRENRADLKMIGRLMWCQTQALKELRLESEELYQAAVKIDTNLIPFKYNGPKETPFKKNYPFPDGEYIDTTRKWL